MSFNIWAVGRNYSEHMRELNNTPDQPAQIPMIFLKAGTGVVENGQSFALPSFTQDIHHEVEIALRFALSPTGELKIDAFTVALDLTAREVQDTLKAARHPWTLAKSFKNSAPMGPWHVLSRPAEPSEHPELQNLSFTLHVNDELRQTGSVKDMIFSMQLICDYLRQRFPVEAGDVVLTGTPAGVSKIKPNDILKAEIKNYLKAQWSVKGPSA
jgi:acylpyruvate hydrolase